MLLATGAEDYYLVEETNSFLEQTLPHCTRLHFEHTGHLVNIEQAPQFNVALSSHMLG